MGICGYLEGCSIDADLSICREYLMKDKPKILSYCEIVKFVFIVAPHTIVKIVIFTNDAEGFVSVVQVSTVFIRWLVVTAFKTGAV